MALVISKILSIGAAATVVGGVAIGGHIAYKNREVILKTFALDSTSKKPKFNKKTTPLAQLNSPTEEDLDDSSEAIEEIDVIQQQKPTNNQPNPSTKESSTTPIKSVAEPVVEEGLIVEDLQEIQDQEHQPAVVEPKGSEHIQQQVDNQQKQDSSSSVLDGGDFVYLIAKFTEATSKDSSKKLQNGTPTKKNYLCNYQKTQNTSFNNTTCQIYKLSTDNSKKELIDFPKTETENEVTQSNDLSNDSNFLLKISSRFHQQITKNNQKINLLEIGESNYSFGIFSNLVELDKAPQKLNKEIIKSNLFTVFVTNVSSTFTDPVDYTTNSYKCQLTRQSPVNCKFYGFSTAIDTYDKSKLDAVSQISTVSTHLKVDKYILVSLEGEAQTTPQLQGRFQIFKSSDLNTPIVTGVGEELVIGNLDASSTPAKSNLFIPKDTFGTLSDVNNSSSSGNAYIITKTTAINEYLKKGSSYDSGDYICRVIAGNNKYDDDSCKLFEYPSTSKTEHFDINDYKAPSGIVDNFDQLRTNKHQVMVLKKELQTALKAENSALYLIRKDRKDKVLNNIVFTMSKVYELTDDVSSDTALKTNLILVRFKKDKPTTAVQITKTNELTCSIDGDSTPVKCKIYRFKTPQRSNAIAKDAISQLRDQTNTNFTADFHYVIELIGVKKDASELENKSITLKKDDDVLGTFEFDSLIFGVPKVGGMTLKRDEESYLVEKVGKPSWSSLASANTYRCKLPTKPDESKADNFDFGCKLIEIKRASNQYITTYSNIRGLTENLEASALKTSVDKYYKLTFDKKLLYNFELSESQTTQITLEIIGGKNKYTKTLKVLGKISDSTDSQDQQDAFTTSTKIGIFEIEQDPSSSSAHSWSSSTSCNFEDSTDNKFDCQIYKVFSKNTVNIATTSTALTELKATINKASDYSKFQKNNLFLIDFLTEKTLNELKNKKIVYHYSENISSSDKDGSTTITPTRKQVTFTLKGLLLGTNTDNKQLFFVEDPTFPSKQ